MNDKQIKTFITIADCGSFTQAEEILFTSKQALTKRIDSLESELGFPLFIRQHHGVILSEGGKLFYPGAKKILFDQIALIERCRKQLNQAKELKISKIESHMLMDSITLKYAEKYPDIQISHIMYSGRNEVERVKEGSIDIGETPYSKNIEHLDLAYQPLITLNYTCLLSNRHPLSKKETISINDIVDYEVVIDERQYTQDQIHQLKTSLSHLTMNTTSSEWIQSAYQICQANQIFITPAYYSRFLKGITSIPFSLPWQREYGLVYRKNPNQIVRNYLELARVIYSIYQ